MINILYKIFRLLLFPLIFLANFLQNKLTSFFTPMNMGPVSKDDYSLHIKKNISKKDFILDYGSGAGFFSRLFNPKKYLGVDINRNFIRVSKNKNHKYNYRVLEKDYLKGYEKKINLIFINNVLHHLTDYQIFETFSYFKKKLNDRTKFFIIEPLFPKSFFSLEFFMKVIDIGNNIKTKKSYLFILRKVIKIENYYEKKVGIGSVLIIKGRIKK
jgi:SAM-dependent methyltransferase